jgi:hypothetical protein
MTQPKCYQLGRRKSTHDAARPHVCRRVSAMMRPTGSRPVPPAGLEPASRGFRDRRSAIELRGPRNRPGPCPMPRPRSRSAVLFMHRADLFLRKRQRHDFLCRRLRAAGQAVGGLNALVRQDHLEPPRRQLYLSAEEGRQRRLGHGHRRPIADPPAGRVAKAWPPHAVVRQLPVPAPPDRGSVPGSLPEPVQLLERTKHLERTGVESPATSMHLQHGNPP